MASGELEDSSLSLAGSWSRTRNSAQSFSSVTTVQLFTFLATCFGLHALLRWLVTETAGMDDVDQVLRAQIWSWGYGPQPPLYTWLTKIFLGTFGYSVLSMLLLKELLMLSIYALVYATARRITSNHLCGLLATVLLQTNFSISWEAHRDLTHSVLASAFSVATLYMFLCLKSQRWRDYLLLGFCFGLGILSKYNYVIVWLGLMVAALSLPEMRPLLFNRKMLVALLLMLAICAPHFVWFARHPELAFSSVWKLKMDTTGHWAAIARGLGSWGAAILGHAGPMTALVAVMFGMRLRGSFLGMTPEQRFAWRALLAILAIVTINIVVFRVTGLRDRYVQPLFVWVPVLLVCLVSDRISRLHLRLLVPVGALSVIAIMLAAPGRVLLTERLHKHEVLNTPFRRLAADLSPEAAKVDCLVAENLALAGNLRLWFPDKLVVDPEVGPLFPSGQRDALLIWDSAKSAEPPEELVRFAQAFTEQSKVVKTSICQEILKYHHLRTISLGMAVVE